MTNTGHEFALPVNLMIAHIDVALLVYQANKVSTYN